MSRIWTTNQQQVEVIAGREVKMPRMLTNEGQCAVMEGDKRVALVDAQTKAKRGEAWKVECAERDRNARLIAKAPELLDLLQRMDRDCGIPGPYDHELDMLEIYIDGEQV